LRGKTILIVEDNFIIGAGLAAAATEMGAVVLSPFGSVAETLDVIGHQKIDGALLNVHLNDGNALKIVAALENCGIPFIVVTGYERKTLPLPLRRAPYLAKPVGYETLLQEMRATFNESADKHRASASHNLSRNLDRTRAED
jgi:DNA-binding NtrC family response regulator